MKFWSTIWQITKENGVSMSAVGEAIKATGLAGRILQRPAKDVPAGARVWHRGEVAQILARVTAG